MIYVDTETCGLHGFVVLIQWAKDDGPINIHDIWLRPIHETLELIERITNDVVCGFNLVFDWFHLCKCYTTFKLCDPNWIPIEHVDEIAIKEKEARDGHCLKPLGALDLMLHARKGPYQSLMNRGDIRINRVPTPLAKPLASELEARVALDGIYFARRKDKTAPQWNVYDREKDDGSIDIDFKDVVLKFHPSGGLKILAQHAGIAKETIYYGDIEPKDYPNEVGYAPFALALGKPGAWNGTWPELIRKHVAHWHGHNDARKYASDDIVYTRGLERYFSSPTPNDDDSILACCVAAVRWRGFAVDLDIILGLRSEAIKRSTSAPTSPQQVRHYLEEVLSPIEKVVIQGSTKKEILKSIAESAEWDGHPAQERAKKVLEARSAVKEIEVYNKLLLAGRLHASFVIIGTLSSRMSGSDDFNAQAIKNDPKVRRAFTLAFLGYILSGGDFDAFEVVIAEATYKDPVLREELLSGKKIHALFAVEMFPDMSYEEVMETKGVSGAAYDQGKHGVFTLFYGGDDNTLVNKYGVQPEIAEQAFDGFFKSHPTLFKERQKIFDMFCSMRQPNGIGTKVEWHEPSDYISSLFGFKRYFTLENKICKVLFDLACNPPMAWRNMKMKVSRRAERVQTAYGATQSALYAAAFQIQAANMRAAANHVIQSSGATITKKVQRNIWELQPHGYNEFKVIPMNIHDEVLCPNKIQDEVKEVVDKTVESFRPQVPLIKMIWNKTLKNWAEK